MEFSQPPPDMSNMGNQFNNFSVPPPVPSNQMHRPPGQYHAGKPGQPFFRPFVNFNRGPGALPMTQDDFDGKRLRKSVMRKTVDYNAAIIKALEVSNIDDMKINSSLTSQSYNERIASGKETFVTDALFNLKVFTLQK